MSSLFTRAVKTYRRESFLQFLHRAVEFSIENAPLIGAHYIALTHELRFRSDPPGHTALLIIKYVLGVLLGTRISLALTTRKIRRAVNDGDGFVDVLDTAEDFLGFGRYVSIRPMQRESEIIGLLDILDERDPEAVMEIGTARGGTLFLWMNCLASATYYLSLDIGAGKRSTFWDNTELYERFVPAKTVEFVRGDSTEPRTIDQVNNVLGGRSIDFMFIDGDHSYQGVKADFENYKRFLAEDGIIAFHDIVNDGCEVPRFWKELKDEYRTTELIAETDSVNGIGVLFLED
jgi:cephalosporin hydroxylase